MARDLSTYNRVSSVAPKQNNTALGDAISGLAEMSVNIIKQEQASNMTKLYSDMQLELNELDHTIKVEYESNPQLAQEKYKESFTKIVDRYGANVSPSLTRDWEASVNKVKTNSLLQMQNWGFKQGQINTKRNIASSLDNIYKMATSQGMDYGLGDGDDLDVLLGVDASLSPLMHMSSKMLGEETTKQMFDGVNESYMKSFISGVAETNPMRALELLNDEQVVSKMNAGHRSEMQKAIKGKVMNFQKEMEEQEVLNYMLKNTEMMQPMTYAQLQNAFDGNPDISDNAKKFFLKRNGFTDIGDKGLVYDDLRSQVAEKGLTPELKESIIEEGNKGNLTKAEIKGLLGRGSADSKMLQAEKITQATEVRGRVAKASDMNAVELRQLQDDIYRATNSGALKRSDAEYYLSQVIPNIADARKQDIKNEEGRMRFDIFERVDNYFRNSVRGKGADEGVVLYNAKERVKLYDLMEENLKEEIRMLNNPDVQGYGDIGKLPSREAKDMIKRASRNAIDDYAKDRFPELDRMKDKPVKVNTGTELISTGEGQNNEIKFLRFK